MRYLWIVVEPLIDTRVIDKKYILKCIKNHYYDKVPTCTKILFSNFQISIIELTNMRDFFVIFFYYVWNFEFRCLSKIGYGWTTN